MCVVDAYGKLNRISFGGQPHTRFQCAEKPGIVAVTMAQASIEQTNIGMNKYPGWPVGVAVTKPDAESVQVITAAVNKHGLHAEGDAAVRRKMIHTGKMECSAKPSWSPVGEMDEGKARVQFPAAAFGHFTPLAVCGNGGEKK